MNKDNAKKGGNKSLISLLGRTAFLVAIMFLIIYIIVVLASSGEYFNEFSERSAYILFDRDIEQVNELAQENYEYIYGIADKLKYADSREKVEEIMASYIGSVYVGDLRFYSQGKAYTSAGTYVEKEFSGNELISALSVSMSAGCTDIYYDELNEVYCIAFFVPVRGSVYVDGVLSIVPVRNIINLDNVLRDNTDALILIDRSGRVFSEACSNKFSSFYTVGNDFYSFINRFVNDAEGVIEVEKSMRLYEKTVCSVNTIGGSYAVVMSPVEAFEGNLILISVSGVEGLVAPELTYVRHVANISIITIIAFVIGSVCAVIYYKKTQMDITDANYTDNVIGCANAEQFRNKAGSSIRGSNQSYAVAIFEVRQFRYIEEKLNEKDLIDLLKHIAKVIESLCDMRETYGYLGNGRFALLLIYASERSLKDRARLVEAVVNKHPILGKSKVRRNFNIGASIVNRSQKHTVHEYLNFADMALEKSKNNINLPYVIYNEKLNTERAHNDIIETEMESALEGNEFRLFLQPKYNVADDRIDSAEALVRWFDPKTGDYRFPGEFIGLFESNGFITKLDHFMYIETLKYLSQAVERGEKVVPISVNVSLVTVSAADFLDFYIENKKKYRIGDNFIIIEFTESFAMGDHQKIREMVDALHANGIRCSLDDFGSGYSSLGVIKNIPFDELKFDRMFLASGMDATHDEAMLRTLFSLAKSLGMRVVQEGVETKEVFDNVVAMGCDVIQGYYYAKAIPVEEYKLFINMNTSIKYKSKVK